MFPCQPLPLPTLPPPPFPANPCSRPKPTLSPLLPPRFFFPANPSCLLKLLRLGYLRTAELFCKVHALMPHDVWRTDSRTGFGAGATAAGLAAQLASIQHQIFVVVADLQVSVVAAV